MPPIPVGSPKHNANHFTSSAEAALATMGVIFDSLLMFCWEIVVERLWLDWLLVELCVEL
jgi:hypothetical protein